jgi:hypothetical protein
MTQSCGRQVLNLVLVTVRTPSRVLRNVLKNMHISARSTQLIPRIRYYAVTHMGQKKELLGHMQKSLRNPCNRLALPGLERVEKKFFRRSRLRHATLVLLTGTPAVLRAQEELSNSLGLASGNTGLYVRLEYSL